MDENLSINFKGNKTDKKIKKEYHQKINDLKLISEVTNKEGIKYEKLNNLIQNDENFQDEGL